MTVGCLIYGGRSSGRSSVVERLLAKEKVVGSNPIARSAKVQEIAQNAD